ncbi:MAG: hypothetical protein KIH89_003075 [Candidatus Shapirobacteria bacterium]|nr:hypothetical protein [Candidatus Shapirobacteria bacterium]
MKSNISTKDINAGKKVIENLLVKNPRLIPYYLKEILPKYKKFSPNIYKYGLWCCHQKLSKNLKYDKIIFLVSGLAAAGKDSIYQEMTNLIPDMFFKTITATSRPLRENETDGIDYFFYQTNEFIRSLKNNEFLEFIKRGETYYGLPKKSLDFAFNQPKPIIYCQIEMSGWSKLEKYIKSKKLNVLIIKEFIMPDMSVSEYISWLTNNRLGEDLESRINKSGWEIQKAATKANIILTNRIRENIPTLNYIAKTVINQLIETANLTEFTPFKTIADTLSNTHQIEEIISAHDNI